MQEDHFLTEISLVAAEKNGEERRLLEVLNASTQPPPRVLMTSTLKACYEYLKSLLLVP